MKPFPVLALVGLALMSAAAHADPANSQPSPAPVITLSASDKQHLLHDAFKVVRTVREIPEPVRRQLVPPSKDPLAGMADAGQDFQVSDALGHKPLPFRRLIFAAASPGYCLVYYEMGGIAYRQMVALFRRAGGGAKQVWAAQMKNSHRRLSLPELRAAIRTGEYIDMR